jgi:hypothetical protein
MSLFSYHLVKLSWISAFRIMLFPVNSKQIKGLIHSETMSAMILGSSIYSINRIFNREIAVFAQWENEVSLNDFLSTNKKGKQLVKGWYLKLEFLRQWGKISGFQIPIKEDTLDDNEPVVAITIARMKYTQIPRFLRWGKPVEKQVRDNTETTLSLASIRYPNIISTFSIWKTKKDMINMVHGHSEQQQSKRHVNAMKERDRKDFHFEFTTLRFKPLSEHGQWKNKSDFIPIKKGIL